MNLYKSRYLMTATAGIGMACFANPVVQAADKQAKPNVVLLFIDDLGYGDTGPFGCKDIPTPNIDRLAKEGVVLTQAYVTNPPCSPSRCSLMTGMYGQRFGKYGMARGLAIPDDKPTMGEFMRDNGYVTGHVGKWDIGTKFQGPSAKGFMEVAESPKRVVLEGKNSKKGKESKKPKTARFLYKTEDGKTGWLTDYDGDKLIEFIDRNHKKDPSTGSGQRKPFFMYWSPYAVHSPHDNIPESLSSRTTAPKNRRKLGGGIVSVDDQVGKLLNYLDKNKMRENTLIILSSDNGANLGEGGSSTPYRGGKGKGTQQIGWTLAPTVISWPGTVPQGKRFDGLCCTLDFYATMAAAAKIEPPKHLDGVDLIPYLKGEKEGAPHEYLYWLNKDPTDPDRRNLVAVRWKKWRLYRHKEKDPWQLFDLVKDPREEKDVARKFPEIVKQLAEKHAEWKKTLAPLATAPKDKVRASTPVIPKGYGWAITDGKLVPEAGERDRKKNKQNGVKQ